MMPLTLVINLDKSHRRMARISARLDELGIPFERISGVYGADLSEQEIAKHYCPQLNKKNYRRPLRLGEIGCYMSHLKAWQTIVDRELPCALILEDDIIINAELKPLVQRLSRMVADFDIVKLYCKKSNPKIIFRTPIDSRHHLCRFRKVLSGNLAQLITLEAAKKMLATYQQFGRPVDVDIQHWWEADLNVLGVFPSVVHIIENAESDIDMQDSRIGRTRLVGFFRNIVFRASYEFKLRKKIQKLPIHRLFE